jgi:PAS domain S-box-containing protein
MAQDKIALLEAQLRQSEEIFRNLAENANAGIAIVQGTKFVYVNPYFCTISNYTQSELLTMDIARIVHPDFRDLVLDRAHRRQHGEAVPSHYEFMIVACDRPAIWLDFSAGRISYFGKPAIVCVAFDITDRKQAQEDLRRSEEQFRLTSEAAHIGSWQWDFGEEIRITDQCSRILGIEAGVPLTISRLNELIHPDDRARVEENRQTAIRRHTEYDIEYRIIRPDGRLIWLHSRGRAWYDPDGKPLRAYGVFTDVTQRKLTETALRESEEIFRSLAENANAVIGIMQDFRFVYVNAYLEALSGYSRDELLHIDLAKLLHPDFRQLVLTRAAQRLAGVGVESKYQFVMITRSGAPRWIDYAAARIMYHGSPAIVGIGLDITEGKRNEEQLIRLKNDFESKSRELENVISIVSHDLRAPIVNVKGFANEIAKDSQAFRTLLADVRLGPRDRKQCDQILSESIPESLRFIQTSADAMNNLVVSLTEVARAGAAIPKPELLDMNELIAKVIETVEIKVKQASAALDVEPLPACFADKTQVAQIFTNLLDNAMKYLDPSRPGRICVGGKLEAHNVLYWVSDNGIGISPEHLTKIFEPYTRLKEKVAEGMGLGLVTVKRMVDRNNGRIWIVSEKNAYSTFFISLPTPPGDR